MSRQAGGSDDGPGEGVWAGLARADAYPNDPDAAAGVEWVQTHLSHVFLTRTRVYKFRKAVDLGFVDFSTRAERNADCLREVTLNRRLAPDVYHGVAALLGREDARRVGPVGEALTAGAEHCVVMRRLPAGRDASSLLEAGVLCAEQIDRLAGLVARFHAGHGLGTPAPFAPDDWLARCTEPAEQNFRSLAEAGPSVIPPERLALARERARGFVAEHAGRFERRRAAGRAVDAHGDLHLQHVFFERDDAEPLVIDCLEFTERLRHIDAAAEVAFPAMDLAYRGHPRWAERFLRVYAAASDDFDLYSVVDYFTAYRAGVRAKVAALAARDAGIAVAQREAARESARRHLELAALALAPRPPRALVLTSGVVGTGKSTVAARLAERLDAVVIASDRVRKHRLGLAPEADARAAWGAGAYAPEAVARVYAALFERARPVLASGRVAILDATFACRDRRTEARALAAELGCPAFLVETLADPERTLERLAARRAAGGDPSDAGPEIYAQSAKSFEPVDEWPAAERATVRTDAPDWPRAADAVAERIDTLPR